LLSPLQSFNLNSSIFSKFYFETSNICTNTIISVSSKLHTWKVASKSKSVLSALL
jgi:hypothetical protein